MLHEALVEPPVLDPALLAADVAVLHVDLRGLREARQLLVRRLGGDDARRVGTEVGKSHRETPCIERMEFHEAGPGFIEQDVVAQMTNALEDHLGVVDRAVISALLDHGDAEGTWLAPGFRIFDQGMVADALAQRCFVERVPTHGADQPPGVACRRNINRNAAADHQCAVVGGLVIVAVEQNQVTVGDECGQRHLVRGRGAVEHEVGLLGAKDLGGFLLCLQGGTLVGQQVAKIEHRVVEVVAKHRFAEVLHEHPADRAAAIEHAAIVARAGPELVAFLGVVDKRAEERRFQRLGILLQTADEVFCDERRRLLREENVAVDEVEHFDGEVLEPLVADQEDDREVQAAACASG